MTISHDGWTGDDLARTGEHLVVVSQATAARLARHLPASPGRPDPGRISDFSSLVTGLLGEIAAAVLNRVGPAGPGLALVTGEGLAELTDSQLTALLSGLSVLLGRPMAQNSADELIVSVLDERPADVERARGYRTNTRMHMHTDPTDVAALLCLRQGAAGGASLFVSAKTVHDALAAQAPLTMPEYYRVWDWDLRGMQRPGASRLAATPIFSSYGGQLSCRYGSLMLREGARAGGGLSAEAAAALDLFEHVAQQPDHIFRHTLRRGESAWFDNYRVLHGREAFEDRAATQQVRHLLRTWIWLHQRPALAPEFTEFSNAMDRGQRKEP